MEKFRRDPTILTYNAATGGLDEKYFTEFDRLGAASGQAQQLNHPITSVSKLTGTDHTIVLSICPSSCSGSGPSSGPSSDASSIAVNGFIKYGVKNLYFYKKDGTIVQSSPICLLDFYVDETVQRGGVGLILFKKMLQLSSVDPQHIAYDRPSPKLIGFMMKHFNMINPDLQPNRYAIYDGFPL